MTNIVESSALGTENCSPAESEIATSRRFAAENMAVAENGVRISEEHLKSNMRLAWAEGKIFLLESQLSKINEENREREQQQDALRGAIQLLKSELAAKEDTLMDRERRLIELHEQARASREATMTEQDDQKAQLPYVQNRNSTLRAQVLELSGRIDSQKLENEMAETRNKATIQRLAAENMEIKAELKSKMVDDAKFKETKSKNATLSAHLRDSEGIRAALQYQVNNLRNQETDLRNAHKNLQDENAALKGQADPAPVDPIIQKLKLSIASCITQLDLANNEIRVYTCYHHDLSNTWNEPTATRIKPIDLVANEMFRKWAHDKEFIRLYKRCRKDVLRHHKAHETGRPGKGEYANEIANGYYEIDHSRGLNISYTY